VTVRAMLAEALDCGLLQRVVTEENREFVFAPGLPTDKFTVMKALEILDNAGCNQFVNAEIPEFTALEKDFELFKELLEKSEGNRLLRDI
jgi:hypothetical protein